MQKKFTIKYGANDAMKLNFAPGPFSTVSFPEMSLSSADAKQNIYCIYWTAMGHLRDQRIKVLLLTRINRIAQLIFKTKTLTTTTSFKVSNTVGLFILSIKFFWHWKRIHLACSTVLILSVLVSIRNAVRRW